MARVGDRALMAYVQANDPHDRGALRVAQFRALPEHAGLERMGTDCVLAPAAFAVAIDWDGTTGAVVYTVPRPHRGEAPGTHRRRPGSTERALGDPLGPSALTAAESCCRAGATPRGTRSADRCWSFKKTRAHTEWPSRATKTTGSSRGPAESASMARCRARCGCSQVTARGRGAICYASDTGFTGHVGDVVRVMGTHSARAEPVVVWAGAQCAALEGMAPRPELLADPSEAAGVHAGELRYQHPTNEHPGPPIECEAHRLFAVQPHRDGTSGPIVAGPLLATDAFAVLGGAVVAAVAQRDVSALVRVPIDARALFGTASVIVQGVATPSRGPVVAAGDDSSPLLITPSRSSTARAAGWPTGSRWHRPMLRCVRSDRRKHRGRRVADETACRDGSLDALEQR